MHRRKQPVDLTVHMHNSACYNGQKAVDKMRRNRMIHVYHPPDPPDLSPCEIWLCGVLKDRIKENVCWNAGEVEELVAVYGVMWLWTKCSWCSLSRWDGSNGSANTAENIFLNKPRSTCTFRPHSQEVWGAEVTGTPVVGLPAHSDVLERSLWVRRNLLQILSAFQKDAYGLSSVYKWVQAFKTVHIQLWTNTGPETAVRWHRFQNSLIVSAKRIS
jgi:hypothetical protein